MHINKKSCLYPKYKMSYSSTTNANTQNELLMQNLMDFYKKNENENLIKMMKIINGETHVSLRIVDWFVTNYAKKNYTVYGISAEDDSIYGEGEVIRFKVYNEYKLKLNSYGKKRFDPFCRWERIYVQYDDNKSIETTIGQLNFFKWAIEKNIIGYILENYDDIEKDMNTYNRASSSSQSSKKDSVDIVLVSSKDTKTRKKREELSISACKCIKKENVKIVVKFNV